MVLTSLKSRKFASDCESYRLRAATGQRPDRISQSRQRQFASRSVYQNRQNMIFPLDERWRMPISGSASDEDANHASYSYPHRTWGDVFFKFERKRCLAIPDIQGRGANQPHVFGVFIHPAQWGKPTKNINKWLWTKMKKTLLPKKRQMQS